MMSYSLLKDLKVFESTWSVLFATGTEFHRVLHRVGTILDRLSKAAKANQQYVTFSLLRNEYVVAGYEIMCMDEFIDALLTQDRVLDVILPRITKRTLLEDNGDLEPRVSPLEEAMSDASDDGDVSRASEDGLET